MLSEKIYGDPSGPLAIIILFQQTHLNNAIFAELTT